MNVGFSNRANLSSAAFCIWVFGFGILEQNGSVQLTLLYAVGPDLKVGAARIGQTERRATLLDAL